MECLDIKFSLLGIKELKTINEQCLYQFQVFGDRLFGNWSWLIPVFVALSTFGGVNGVLFTSARLFATGAQEGHMPGFFTLFHVDKQTPIPSLIFTVSYFY